MKKIMLAYSGGLDTSCLLAWLKEQYNVPIVAYCADVGQKDDFGSLHKKAIKTGAVDCVVDDLKDEFVGQYIFPALKANTVYESYYLLGTSLARPVIAKGLIEAALRHGCDAIAHGATGKGNDQVRFELAAKALAPHLQILAPWRYWDFKSRSDLFEYAKIKGIELPVTPDKPYSMDENLMHISYEGGILEDPWHEPAKDMFLWTTAPEDAPDEAEYIEIGFDAGEPVTVNGLAMKPVEIVSMLNMVGAKHGIGRVDIVENRYVGIKSRGVYETPGITILMHAHKAVESLTLDREVSHLKDSLSQKLATAIYNGYWFAPETKLLLSTIEATQGPVTGTAKLKLFKGSSQIVGRQAPNSLYSASLASFEEMASISPADAGGFININGLRLSMWSKTHESIAQGIPAKA